MYKTNFSYCFYFLFTVIVILTASCTNKLYTSHSAKENHTPELNNSDRKLLFVSNQDGDREIFLTNLKGESLKQLTNNSRDDFDASWSPDGQFILFTSNRDGGDSEIYVMGIDGSQQTNLSRSAGYDGQPRWSPDSKSIVFNSDRNGGIGLYIMSFDGENIQQISKENDTDGYAFPAWSPNGKWISFSKQDFNGKSNVWIVKVDGSESLQLTNNSKSEEGQVHWSPNSQKLLYHSRRNREYNIYSYDLKSKKEQQLTHLKAADSRPQWSNKGDEIVFLSTRGALGRTQLFIMKEDGSQPKSLSDARFQVDDATWLLDDSGLLFVSWQRGVSNVYSVDMKTGKQIAISPAKGYQSQPLPEPVVLPKYLSLSRHANTESRSDSNESAR
ncbi:MAG: Tol biopolymer transport system component [Colwellia sp.]|jgi:Tol biopolymer transport system component